MKQFIEQITRQAGDAILKMYRKPDLKHRTKANAADFVTEADELSNKILINAIKKHFFGHGIISEETGVENENDEYTWILDPLDGTRNFLTHTPLWGVIVGLVKKGEIIAGAVYCPVIGEFGYAERGKGAFLNGKRVHAAASHSLHHSYGCTNTLLHPQMVAPITKLAIASRKYFLWHNEFDCMAPSALMVASGRRDWYVSDCEGMNDWDYAAPKLLFAEAGYKVTNLKGRPWRFGDKDMLVANRWLHPQLMKLLR